MCWKTVRTSAGPASRLHEESEDQGYMIFMRKIAVSMFILSVLLCIGAEDARVLAQTADAGQDMASGQAADPPYAASIGEPPAEEPPDRREPGVITETVEPVVEPWRSTEGFGEKIDWLHGWLYEMAESQVLRFDSWFKPAQGDQGIFEPSRFRVGLYGEGKIREHRGIDIEPVADFDTEIDLPNVKRWVRLILTTSDPTTLPGRSFIEQRDNSLRAAIVGRWRSDISTAIGLRARWKPELFAYAVWARRSKAGNWGLYPQQKFYWESRDGFGEISTLVLDHWINRWNTRFSTSVKWSRQDRDDDKNTGRRDEGFRWSEVFLLEHAKELLEESQLGRVVSGDDIARGWGIRLSAFGGFHFTDEYRAGIFYRWPLRKKWMYAYAGPEIKWRNSNDWDREWTLRCGIEMLFWGGKER